MCHVIHKKTLASLLFLSLGMVQTASAADKSWNKIRYQGGTVQVRVNPFDWNTTVKVTPTTLVIGFSGLKTLSIDFGRILTLSHGEKAYHRVAEMLLSTPAARPLPLFGIIQTDKDHLIAITFRNTDGSQGAILLLVQKDSYAELLRAVSGVTGKAVED